MTVRDVTECAGWQALQAQIAATPPPHISQLFASDQRRTEWTHVAAEDLVLDFSRQRMTREVLDRLTDCAESLQLRQRIEAMYRGDLLNVTEGRAVLHTALRRQAAPHAAEVRAEREHMLDFAESIRDGRLRGSTGLTFQTVVNIGIGGSDLGPQMAVEALKAQASATPQMIFVSNVDGCRLADVLASCDPSRTLFIVCSKTFTTLETLTNAHTARHWIRANLGDGAIPQHFAAVSVNGPAMDEFGVHPRHRFRMWDWVGGRYSLWSSIGVSLAIAIGRDAFLDFLRGGAAMDEHFRTAPWDRNLPALLGLIGAWNVEFLRLPTLAVLPYDERLARFPAYLQQLDMESNGKSVRVDGSPVACETAPVIWGEPGNNAQHSFFQMLHQGTPRAALDFLLPAETSCSDRNAHELAIANALAQAEAFAYGQPAAEIDAAPRLVPHKVHAGNRPSSLLLFRRTDPLTLGKLVALYEHKIFTQSVLWDINAFDQWGVELGKRLCDGVIRVMQGRETGSDSLQASVARLREFGAASPQQRS